MTYFYALHYKKEMCTDSVEVKIHTSLSSALKICEQQTPHTGCLFSEKEALTSTTNRRQS
jgi:hypothetical protein